MMDEEERDISQLALSAVESNTDTTTASSSNNTTQLPPCERTLLYRFAGAHGFASEYLIFLRVVTLAKRFKYALFVDDENWNYGSWSE